MIQFYLAGPYTAPTGPQVFAHVMAAVHAAEQVALFRGWLPIVPHVSGPHAVGTVHDHAWSQAMDQCMATISRLTPGRDRMVLLPGWEASKGTRTEFKVAQTLGIEVWTLAEALDPAIIDAEIPSTTMEEKCD